MLLTEVRLDLVISTICRAEGTLGIWKMIFDTVVNILYTIQNKIKIISENLLELFRLKAQKSWEIPCEKY